MKSSCVAFLSALLVAVGLTTVAPVAASESSQVQVTNAWTRATNEAQRTSALYFALENNSDRPLTVAGVSVAGVERSMMHRTVVEQGVAKMQHAHHLEVPAGDTLVFEPGGLHVMLMGIQQPMQEGTMIEFEIEFADGKRLPLKAQVRSN